MKNSMVIDREFDLLSIRRVFRPLDFSSCALLFFFVNELNLQGVSTLKYMLFFWIFFKMKIKNRFRCTRTLQF
jgi:hypothetical protein